MHLARRLCLLALVAVALTGCRLGVSAQIEVARDGSGEAVLVVSLDEALLSELDELAIDPTAELTAVAAAVPTWDLSRTTDGDGGLVLTLRRPADDPQELTDAFRELTAGLTDTDPALAVDLDVDVDDAGAAEVSGTVQLRTPIGPGVVTDEAAAAELAALAADTVDATLVVTLPGEITDSDADEVEGARATWTVPPGEPRTVQATAAAPSSWSPEQLAAVVAGVLLLVSAAVIATVLWRRRRTA